MLKRLVTPSRWGGGLSLLWRGNTFSNYINFLFKNKSINFSILPDSVYSFDSARNALFHYMQSEGIGKGDLVQVMYFTCDAVTDVLLDLECDVKFYDCDSDFQSVDFILEDNCKLLISQITFGRQAHTDEYLHEISQKGVSIILDKSLSYGVKDFDDNGLLQYPTLISFEVSKSITFGWAGLLMLPKTIKFEEYYKSIIHI